jgi:hypothetical protein
MTSECACLNCSGSSSCSERTKDAVQSDLTIIRIRLSIGGVKQRAEQLIVGRVAREIASIVCVFRFAHSNVRPDGFFIGRAT